MKDEALSLYIPEDLEADMRRAGLLEHSWGNGISTAILWTAANCDDLDSLIETNAQRDRENRALTPCRRTSAILRADAYEMLQQVTNGETKISAVVRAMVRHFIAECGDIPAELVRTTPPGNVRPKSVPALPVRFDYPTIQRLKAMAARIGKSEGDVVREIVQRAIELEVA